MLKKNNFLFNIEQETEKVQPIFPTELIPQIKIFVGGPIQFALKNKTFDPQLENIIVKTINLLQSAGFSILSAHLDENFGRKTDEYKVEDIARRDFDWMQECDIYLAVLPEDDNGKIYRSDGTYVELGWASQLGKPVIMITSLLQTDTLSSLVQGLYALIPFKILDIEKVSESPEILLNTLAHYLNAYCNSEARRYAA